MSRLKIWDLATGNWQQAGSVDPVALANDPAFRNALAANASLIAALQANLIGAGTIWSTAAATPDQGWIFLDGSTIANAQTLYPSLWGRIPASWKSGSSLLVPDMRGRTIIGAGTGGGLTARTLGTAISNEEVHLLTAAESGMPAHTPTASGSGSSGTVSSDHTHSGTTAGRNAAHYHVSDGQTVANYDVAGRQAVAGAGWLHGIGGWNTGTESADHAHSFTTGGISANHTHAISVSVTVNQVAAANAAAAHNNMQPSYVLNWQMKVH